MRSTPDTSKGAHIEGHWDGLSAFERFKIIFDYRSLFSSLGLITDRELRKVSATSEGNREYLVERDGHLIFDEIDLTKNFSAQSNRDRLHPALDAILDDLGVSFLIDI